MVAKRERRDTKLIRVSGSAHALAVRLARNHALELGAVVERGLNLFSQAPRVGVTAPIAVPPRFPIGKPSRAVKQKNRKPKVQTKASGLAPGATFWGRHG